MNEPVDTGFGDVLKGEVYTHPEPEVTVAVAAPVVLTPAGQQAAKALIALPNLSFSDLAKLARDVAMDIKERHVVLRDAGLTQAQYDFLESENDFYKSALSAACLEWHAPLTTQKRIAIEAAAILEDSLLGLGARMQNKSEGLPGVIEAAKFFGKIAGVGERDAGSGASGERFVINIDLGGDQKISLSTEAAPARSADAALPGDLQPDTEEPRSLGALPPDRKG